MLGWLIRMTVCRWRKHRGIVAGRGYLSCTRCGLRHRTQIDGLADRRRWHMIGSPSVSRISEH